MPLEDYYSGDNAWSQFLAAHRSDPLSGDRFDPQSDMPGENSKEGNADLLTVAVSYFGRKQLTTWLDTVIEELDDQSPRACILDHKLHLRLRTYLMQLPC
jgi:hypothetical protein